MRVREFQGHQFVPGNRAPFYLLGKYFIDSSKKHFPISHHVNTRLGLSGIDSFIQPHVNRASDYETRIPHEHITVKSGRHVYDVQMLKAMRSWHIAISRLLAKEETIEWMDTLDLGGWNPESSWETKCLDVDEVINSLRQVDVLGDYFWLTTLQGKKLVEISCVNLCLRALMDIYSVEHDVYAIPSHVLRFPVFDHKPVQEQGVQLWNTSTANGSLPCSTLGTDTFETDGGTPESRIKYRSLKELFIFVEGTCHLNHLASFEAALTMSPRASGGSRPIIPAGKRRKQAVHKETACARAVQPIGEEKNVDIRREWASWETGVKGHECEQSGGTILQLLQQGLSERVIRAILPVRGSRIARLRKVLKEGFDTLHHRRTPAAPWYAFSDVDLDTLNPLVPGSLYEGIFFTVRYLSILVFVCVAA
ncbi:unnamed protein product [Phytophthora fragariaefolia]|uniref:Unnamed protein product n=1 Tax=Phytophthora fragariaefolia TaxID=1490495 RepID=A0A9W6WXQ7_9STRA|nr:unnamed protein product [Phytophthora fragariaefolia]